jgi:hypothetical protein
MRRSDRKRRNLATQLWADEQTWVNATRCSELLVVRADISDRKMRLFAVECCRAIAHLFADWQDEALRRIEAIAESPKPWWPCSGIRELDDLAGRRRRWTAWSWSSEWLQVEPALTAARWAILDVARSWRMWLLPSFAARAMEPKAVKTHISCGLQGCFEKSRAILLRSPHSTRRGEPPQRHNWHGALTKPATSWYSRFLRTLCKTPAVTTRICLGIFAIETPHTFVVAGHWIWSLGKG